MRLALIHVNKKEHYLVWSVHHLLLDAWSISLIIKELRKRYHALYKKESIDFKFGVLFSRYLEWSKKQDNATADRFWKEYLEGVDQPTRLSFLKENIVQENPEDYLEYHFSFSGMLADKLKFFTEQKNISVNTVIQSAWAILLHRYIQRNDFIFGIVVSGRIQEVSNVSNMIGLFINTLPVRIKITENTTVESLLKQLKDTKKQIYRYQNTPLSKIQSFSQAHPASLFDVVLNFEMNPEVEPIFEEKMQISQINSYSKTNYPLTIDVSQDKKIFCIDYDSIKFNISEIEQLVSHFIIILENIIRDSKQVIHSIQILSNTEKHQLIVD